MGFQIGQTWLQSLPLTVGQIRPPTICFSVPWGFNMLLEDTTLDQHVPQCGAHVDSQWSLILLLLFSMWLAFEASTFFVFINLCLSKGLQGFLFPALNCSNCHSISWTFTELSCVNAVDLSALWNQIEVELYLWRLLLLFIYFLNCMWQKIKFKQIRAKLSQTEECIWFQTWLDLGTW